MLHWTHSHKYQKYLTLLKEQRIRAFLPETCLFNQGNLKRMINKHGTVYLKPIRGTGGGGIIKITKKDNLYLLHFQVGKMTFTGFGRMYQKALKMARNRVYLIQQGIDLATIDNRPIDFRVLLLKPGDKWLPMGIMGKIAAKDKIVTNKAKGGRAITFQDALKKLNYSEDEITNLEKSILSLGELVGDTLGKDYQYVRENGMDIGIDKKGHYWIFETNSMPRYSLFKEHPNSDLYGTIDKYIRQIRRNYNKKRV